jgi:RNA polymerase sigma-70 factor (ECF subfamily)
MTTAILNPPNVSAASAAPLPAPPAVAVSLESIDTLHAKYSQRIFRFLLTSLRDRDLAESLTQDTFIRAWAARDSFRGDCAPATWLTRIALNLVRDHTRTNRFRFWRNVANTAVDASEFASFIPDRVSTAESALSAHQQVALVWKTVATLSERQRTVFLLRFVEDLELADIAQITGMPISTVKTHLYRGLAAIRAEHNRPANQARKDA